MLVLFFGHKRCCHLSDFLTYTMLNECKLFRKKKFRWFLFEIVNILNIEHYIVLSKGIKTPCIFNELQYYHMFDDCTVDLMHDLNEGAIHSLWEYSFNTLFKKKLHRLVICKQCVVIILITDGFGKNSSRQNWFWKRTIWTKMLCNHLVWC